MYKVVVKKKRVLKPLTACAAFRLENLDDIPKETCLQSGARKKTPGEPTCILGAGLGGGRAGRTQAHGVASHHPELVLHPGVESHHGRRQRVAVDQLRHCRRDEDEAKRHECGSVMGGAGGGRGGELGRGGYLCPPPASPP